MAVFNADFLLYINLEVEMSKIKQAALTILDEATNKGFGLWSFSGMVARATLAGLCIGLCFWLLAFVAHFDESRLSSVVVALTAMTIYMGLSFVFRSMTSIWIFMGCVVLYSVSGLTLAIAPIDLPTNDKIRITLYGSPDAWALFIGFFMAVAIADWISKLVISAFLMEESNGTTPIQPEA